MLSPAERSLRARIGAYTLHARHDPRETTRNARAAFLTKFLDQADPERTLPEPERLRRAEYARKAHFARLALASARARATKKSRTSERANAPVARRGGSGEEVRGADTRSS